MSPQPKANAADDDDATDDDNTEDTDNDADDVTDVTDAAYTDQAVISASFLSRFINSVLVDLRGETRLASETIFLNCKIIGGVFGNSAT